MPSTNVGKLMPMIAKPCPMRSRRVPGCFAEPTPIGIPIASHTMTAPSTSDIVTGMRREEEIPHRQVRAVREPEVPLQQVPEEHEVLLDHWLVEPEVHANLRHERLGRLVARDDAGGV